MPFMYLHLRTHNGDVHAEVKSQGAVVGTANSRSSIGPLAVIRIDHFDGLENIDINDLEAVLLSKMSDEYLLNRLSKALTNDQVMELVRRRIGGVE